MPTPAGSARLAAEGNWVTAQGEGWWQRRTCECRNNPGAQLQGRVPPAGPHSDYLPEAWQNLS